ncbi:hypothetical protein Celaphus_00016990 [Cervus elaphus hippelaphus]|uniref:Uncharacterized protein n=1 Tax=Cervus elaphus hippelaphus TaxID=46360 RepID=A0A212CMN2_CEREH|nr:hypothetical protein Celaphus_00016990 [Cervus elaphus hippelaphus]
MWLGRRGSSPRVPSPGDPHSPAEAVGVSPSGPPEGTAAGRVLAPPSPSTVPGHGVTFLAEATAAGDTVTYSMLMAPREAGRCPEYRHSSWSKRFNGTLLFFSPQFRESDLILITTFPTRTLHADVTVTASVCSDPSTKEKALPIEQSSHPTREPHSASVDKVDWQLGGNQDDFDPETSHPRKPCSQWILEVTGWKRVLLLNKGNQLQNKESGNRLWSLG